MWNFLYQYISIYKRKEKKKERRLKKKKTNAKRKFHCIWTVNKQWFNTECTVLNHCSGIAAFIYKDTPKSFLMLHFLINFFTRTHIIWTMEYGVCIELCFASWFCICLLSPISFEEEVGWFFFFFFFISSIFYFQKFLQFWRVLQSINMGKNCLQSILNK